MAKRPTFTTPIGTALWPALDKPALNFNKDGEEYKVTLAIPEAECYELVVLLDKLNEENLSAVKADLPPQKAAKVKLADTPWTPELDEEGNETGSILFKLRQAASVTTKEGKTYNFSVALFDSFGRPCPDAPVGAGSQCRANFEVRTWYVPSTGAGMSLQLKAVQVIELKEGGGSTNPKAYGFESEGGGFSYTPADKSDDSECPDLGGQDGDDAPPF